MIKLKNSRPRKARIKGNERVHVIDEATRSRRQRKALDALEKDNFQDDQPQSGRMLSDLKIHANRKLQQRFSLANDPDANEAHEEANLMGDVTETSRKRKLKPESKLRYRKNFTAILEEEVRF